MQKRYLSIFVAITLALIGCQRSFDPEKARAEILELHRNSIEAHLEKDASQLTATIPDDYLFVSDGDVTTLTADDVRKSLQGYFDATTFSHYADTADPIVGFSKDGTLAWLIVRVRVAGTTHRESGSNDPFDIQWAWISLYENRNGEWSRIADVSTDKPFQESE
jgi:hypothetical protein